MSNCTESYVRCDKCNAVSESTDGKAREARKIAKAAHWKLGKQRDLCKHCADELDKAVKSLLAAG